MDPPPNTSQPTAASATTNGTNNVPQQTTGNQTSATLPSVAQPALDMSRKDERGSHCAPCLNARWYDCDILSRAEDSYGKRPECSNCRFFGGPKVDCYKGGSLNDILYHQAMRKTDHSLAAPKVRQDNPKSVSQGWQGQRNPEGQLQLPPNLQGPDLINRLNLTRPIAQPKPKLSRPSSASRRTSTTGPHTVNNSMTINNYYNYPPPNEGPWSSGAAQPSAPTPPHGASQQSQLGVQAQSDASRPSTPHPSGPQASTPRASTPQASVPQIQSGSMRPPQQTLPAKPLQTIMPTDYSTWQESKQPKQSTFDPLPPVSQKRALPSVEDGDDVEAGTGNQGLNEGSQGFAIKGQKQVRDERLRAWLEQTEAHFRGNQEMKPFVKRPRLSPGNDQGAPPSNKASDTSGPSNDRGEGQKASFAEIKAANSGSTQVKQGPGSLITLPENLASGPIEQEDLISNIGGPLGAYEDEGHKDTAMSQASEGVDDYGD